MRINANTGITWTELELTGLLEDEDSHVFYEKIRKHLGLHPFHLTDLNTSLKEILTSQLNFYDQELKGFVIAYRSPKLASPLGDILYDSCFIHVDVEAEFYIFRPKVGCMLKGIVNKKGSDHIGILVHKAFNVSIPKPETENDDWIGENLQIGQEVRFSITFMDFKSRLPFFRGVLDAETYLEGCTLFEPASNDITGDENIDDLYDIPSNQLQQNNSKHKSFVEESAEEKREEIDEKPKKKQKKSRRKESIKQEEKEEESISEESTKGTTKSRKKSKSNSKDTEKIKEEHSDKSSKNDVEVTYSSSSDAEKSLKKKIKKVKVDPDLEVTWNDYDEREKSDNEREHKTSKRQKTPKKIKADPDASQEISENEIERVDVIDRLGFNENFNGRGAIKTETQSWKKNKSFLLNDSDSNSSDDIPTRKPENSFVQSVVIKQEKDSSPKKGKKKLFVDDENSETTGTVQNGEINNERHENETRQREESESDESFGRRKHSQSSTESPLKKENSKKKKANKESQEDKGEENVVKKKRKRSSSVSRKSESDKSSDNLDSDSNTESKEQNVVRKREKVSELIWKNAKHSPPDVASPRKGLKKPKKEIDVEEEFNSQSSQSSNKRKRKNSSSISISDNIEAAEKKRNYSSADEFESKEIIRREINKMEVDLNFKSPENSPKKKKLRKKSESSEKMGNEEESENRKINRLSSSESDDSPSKNRKSKKRSRTSSISASGGYEENNMDTSSNKIEQSSNRAAYSSSDEEATDFSSLLRNIKTEARQSKGPICISPRGSPKKIEIKDEPY